MGRGKLLKSKAREVKALEKARLTAQLDFKKSKKGLDLSLREHTGKLIDRLDFFETMAIIGLTPIFKYGIDWTQVGVKSSQGFIDFLEIIVPGEFLRTGTKAFMEMPDWLEWLLAFGLAYIVVRHAGQLAIAFAEVLGSTFSLVRMGTMFLGI